MGVVIGSVAIVGVEILGVFGVRGCSSPQKSSFARLKAKDLTSARCGIALQSHISLFHWD